MPLWNLVLTEYPSSDKTLLARRLVQDKLDFVQISGDDLRTMFFNEPIPSRDYERRLMRAVFMSKLPGTRVAWFDA